MDSVDLAFTSALDQADLIRRREISPLELTELYLRRIEQLNPKLGSYVWVMADQAIAEARAKTEHLATHPEDLPPFFGVPISIKDLNPIAGVPCSYGIALARKRIAEEDDGLMPIIREAGFVTLGKTATSQLGSLPYTEPPGFPPARNPWNLDFTPGGSSGGASSALAAGLCAIAQGSDGGGSLRGPASCCGLVGMKPSRGRVSFTPVGERLNGLATNGPLGRTVTDTAALLDVMAGYIVGDPYWLPNPDHSFLAATQQRPSTLRIGILTEFPPLGKAHPTCQTKVQETATLLESLGHHVETVEPPDLSALIEPFTVAWQCVVSESNVPWFALERMNRWLLWRAWRIGSGAYLRAMANLQRVSRQIVQYFYPYDVVLTPTFLHPTIRVGEWQKLSSAKILENVIRWVAPCPPFNATGLPALSLPAGFDDNQVPIGVQLVGRPGADETILAVAAQIEAAQPWAHLKPAMASQS